MVFMSQVRHCLKHRLCQSLLMSHLCTLNAYWNLKLFRTWHCQGKHVQCRQKYTVSADCELRVDPENRSQGLQAHKNAIRQTPKIMQSEHLLRNSAESNITGNFSETFHMQMEIIGISSDKIVLRPEGSSGQAELKSCRDQTGSKEKCKVNQRRILNVYADASGRYGLGCVWDKKWIVSKWDRKWLSDHHRWLELLEMKAILVAILTWGHQWSGSHVRFHCDNSMVVEYFRRTARPKKKLFEVYKCIRAAAAELQFDLEVKQANKSLVQFQGTDSLSRMNFLRFFKLLPNMNNVPDVPPDNLNFLLPNVWEDICVSVKLRTI